MARLLWEHLNECLRRNRPLLAWIIWFIFIVSAILIYGFAVGGSLSTTFLFGFCCVVSTVDILLSISFSKKSERTVLKIAFGILKGMVAVLLVIAFYDSLNRLSPTLVATYEARAASVSYAHDQITVTFTDPNGRQKTAHTPHFWIVDFSEEDDLQVGDTVVVSEYVGLFDMTYCGFRYDEAPE